MKDLVRIFKALGDENRLRIVKMLQQRPLCVCEVTEILGIAQSGASRHLGLLHDAGLIEHTRDGQWIIYRLCKKPANAYAARLLVNLGRWANDNSRVVHDRKHIRTIRREQLSCRV
jgi:ArsR family transcriptional regulator